MWGIIPAAGVGSRIQPLAFSKELLPVGSRLRGSEERPRAVSEYLVERMVAGGADKLCFVISPGKSDIMEYYGSAAWGAEIVYAVQPAPAGLCDAIFRAAPLISQTEPVVIGLPDTVWSPSGALRELPSDVLSFLLFPVEHPELFDAVVTDLDGRVLEIRVKQPGGASNWIWGAIKMPGSVFHALHRLWLKPERRDEYFGTLINAWIAQGGHAVGVPAGERYVDVGTLHGYRAAIRLLENTEREEEFDQKIRKEGTMATPARQAADQQSLAKQISELGPWFHNLTLGGIQTAPDHFLGDYPQVKFASFRDAIPRDLAGKSVLDVGCNGGFYSLEMKRRGAARVLGIDTDERYLRQARFAADVEGADIEFLCMPVWDVAELRETFDLVIFMGVLYHLRHPLLALDLIHEHVAKDMLLFQSMQRGSRELIDIERDYDFNAPAPFDQPGYPKMHFIEHRYARDETNWWVPNRACVEAMLRSSGFAIESQPEEEVYICRWNPVKVPPCGAHAVYPLRGEER
jgi:tRNA (mo5U34)-methyltransferase